ncbi:MAG: hypothetical protein COV44_11655 [Deltaproteobacteria bacterium CG11_big_fil_rev_8_21_14_0_20_45_16]|nr:MAG: hypothetical protein COV44_11655 [Deltaproteobacteria bacterium CG11_big_fil_rev_8_21_14_0_20_45_16]
MVIEEEAFVQLQKFQIKNIRKNPSRFIQLIGKDGSGCRRVLFSLLPSASKNLVWLSPQWNIDAPLLWQLAHDRGLQLLGVECPERQRYRILWRELYASQSFDVWILDNLKLKEAEVCFLQQLLRHSKICLIFIEAYPLSSCQERIHVQLSHHRYKVWWSKGGLLKPQYFSADYLELVRTNKCLP